MLPRRIVTLLIPVVLLSEVPIQAFHHPIHPSAFSRRDGTGRRIQSNVILLPVSITNTLRTSLFHSLDDGPLHPDADDDADDTEEQEQEFGVGHINDDKKKKSKNTPVQRMRRRKIKIYETKKLRNTGLLMTLWYVLSVIYNIYSKQMLNLAPEWAWTAAWCQMALGFFLYMVPLWVSGQQRPPELTYSDIQRLLPVAFLHALVHVGGVVSMGAGAVSFTYIVKATEPAISAVLAALILKSYLPLPVYLTLIPVIGGVSLASVSELSFTWKSFNYAMMSNLASASRGIVGKKTMNQRVGKNLTARNLYAIMTILATLILLPVTAVLEGPTWSRTFSRLVANGQFQRYCITCLVASLTYYTYNEVSFMALDNINPVSHALASTLRRVFIILSSMVVFGNQMTLMGALGSGVAVAGTLLYSTTKQYYKEKQLKERLQ